MASLSVDPDAGLKERPHGALRTALPFVLIFALAMLLPLANNSYWETLGTRAAIYWIIVSGLNLVVGFAGQLAIGSVALLTIGAYVSSILVERYGLPASLSYVAAMAVCAVCGLIVGLPALRLRTFYFAMSTIGLMTIVIQIALAWDSVTGGGMGIAGPLLDGVFATSSGFYLLCLFLTAVCTWITYNVVSSRFGRSMVALRDAEVAAEAFGISKSRILSIIFVFSGALAGLAGGLFATLQSYITPDAFTFDLSVLFFIAVLIGGRGSVLGPLLATAILTLLPEFAAPLVAWSTFLYAALLLVIVLLLPGGIAELIDFKNRRPLPSLRRIQPDTSILSRLGADSHEATGISLRGIVQSFGGLKAIDNLDLDVRSGQIHGLIGPNGSGKTTTLNVISGFIRPNAGSMQRSDGAAVGWRPEERIGMGIARTFQTPRIVGEANVLDNVMIGGSVIGKSTFVDALFSLPAHRRDERLLTTRALDCLRLVGLEKLADARADRLQHSELRFVEIARALVGAPRFLLLDEPAAGLSVDEITQLGKLIKAVSATGVGVLLVEHHADLIFDICDTITVLNQGKCLMAGTPAEVRSHQDVIDAYLGK